MGVQAQKTDSTSAQVTVDTTTKKRSNDKTTAIAASDSTTKKKKNTGTTVAAADSPKNKPDSLSIRPATGLSHFRAEYPYNSEASFKRLFDLPHLSPNTKTVYMINRLHIAEDADFLFYALIGVFLFLGILRATFPSYFGSLYKNFFKSAGRLQSKENISQNNLSSLFFNLFFVISVGLCISLLAKYAGILATVSFWLLWCYSSLILVIIYLVKYLTILFSGWIFGMQKEAVAYNYVVFLVNKIIGITVLPLILLLAFPTENFISVAVIVTVSAVAILLIYRYIVSLSIIRSSLKVSPLHFFIYLCAIEIIPILIIYKIAFLKLDGNLL
ncbi:MAG: DUF4271 domain-containing protein [Chitinophagaceae bacterium]|jgi:hypothetical protein|nr:DUF4271 domain-containing protein [Chitinophagaceae bacterium]